MARTLWLTVMGNERSYCMLRGLADATFCGSTSRLDQFDTGRMRMAVNLMARCCTKLGLQGSYALQGIRHGDAVGVLLATESISDFQKVSLLTRSKRWEAASQWRRQNEFVLDEELHEQLLKIAGNPDGRGPERRARAKQASVEEDRSLLWRVIDHRSNG